MADANPSRPGVNPSAGKLEINVYKNEQIVRKADGRLVKRDVSQNGTIRETEVFAGDYEGPEAKKKGIKIIKEADLLKQEAKESE